MRFGSCRSGVSTHAVQPAKFFFQGPRYGLLREAALDLRLELARARLLVIPSPFESLSIVLLEAWNQALPALVNGRCGVLHGQVLRANGGLSYRYAHDFAASLRYLLTNPDVARRLGRQGLAYVEREYRWPHVMQKIESFLGTQQCR